MKCMAYKEEHGATSSASKDRSEGNGSRRTHSSDPKQNLTSSSFDEDCVDRSEDERGEDSSDGSDWMRERGEGERESDSKEQGAGTKDRRTNGSREQRETRWPERVRRKRGRSI